MAFLSFIEGYVIGLPRGQAVITPTNASGVVYTASLIFGPSSTFSKLVGSNSDLSINATTGVVSSAAGIAPNAVETIYIRVQNTALHLAQEYVVTITGAPAITLGNLSFSNTAFVLGTPATGAINNAAPGSVVTATGLPSGVTINGTAHTWAYNGAGVAGTSPIVLTEALAGATNTPHTSPAFNVTISAQSSSAGQADFSNPANSGFGFELGLF